MHLKTFILFPCSCLFLILSYPGPSASSSMSCFLNFWSLLLFPGLPPRTTTWDAQPKVGPELRLTLLSRQDYIGCPTNTLFICPSLTSLFSLRRTLLARAPFGTHHHLQLPSHQASLFNSQLVGVQLIFPNSKKSLILFLSTVFFQISPVHQEKLSCTLAGPTRPALLEGEDPMKALARPRSRPGPMWGLNPGNSPFNTVFQTVLLQCILMSI